MGATAKGDFDAFGDLIRKSASSSASGFLAASPGPVATPVAIPAPAAPGAPEPLPPPDEVGPLTGLDLVEEHISSVLATIDTQREVLLGDSFPVDGYVPARSYGDGEEAVELGAVHERTHGIVVDTIGGLTTDLESLQDVIVEVRQMLSIADQTAATELTALLRRTERNDLGQDDLEESRAEHWAQYADRQATGTPSASHHSERV